MNRASPILTPFDYQPATRIVFEQDALRRVGELACGLNGHRVLLVTDPGIAAVGHPGRASEILQASGLEVTIFDGVRENPDALDIERCVEAAKGLAIDLIIGLGGGSSLDTAKGCNFILTNGGRMQDYWGVGKATRAMLPMIAIPTTAGTGSECQSFALISDEVTHQKMACGDSKAAARIAILDPELTVSQPARVTACTGIDALAHALETAVTTRRTGLSALFSREAFRLCISAIQRVLHEPGDLEARGAMQLGAALAGTAIENSMLGAAHSAANPLTARFGIVHGQAVGLMLPAIIRYNAQQPEARAIYLEYAAMAGFSSLDGLIGQIQEVLAAAGFTRDLLPAEKLQGGMLRALAEEAAKQWTASFNPRPVAADDFERLYEEAFA
jgi:alcohol dehydrogenase